MDTTLFVLLQLQLLSYQESLHPKTPRLPFGGNQIPDRKQLKTGKVDSGAMWT